MATLTGNVLPMNRLETIVHPVGAAIVVRQGSTAIAHGTVTEDEDFTIEIPDDVRGEIEVELVVQNAAPSLATADGNDLHVTLLYSNVNNFSA